MAKGNDGNYLQHSVEVAAAVQLAARHPEGWLHVALAHGMEPFEPCGELPNGQARKRLHKALRGRARGSEGRGVLHRGSLSGGECILGSLSKHV